MEQMQSDSSTTYGNHAGGGAKSQEQQNGDGFASLYSPSVFAPETSLSLTRYSDPAMNDSLYYSRILMQQQQQQHQDMINRHNLCLTRLREAAKEADALRQENANLRSVNRELNKHIGILMKSSANDRHLPTSTNFHNNKNAETTSIEPVNEMIQGLNIGGCEREDVPVESPTSVMENVDVKRISLPKSISVRSNGYLKVAQAAASKTTVNSTQKVFVPVGKKEQEPLELEVYNQGMFKTELCNKWQETGACPYGDHCQFAHGIEELRPVLRHPRYKTEVCRMILAGDVCPYGHRCHFRHALTEQERFMGQALKSRSIKYN